MESLYDEITHLVDEYEISLIRYARSIVHSEDEARDVVQDVFMKYLKYRQKSTEEIKNKRAWLFKSVYHLSVDIVRKRQRHDNLEEHVIDHATPKFEASPAEQLQNKDNREWLQEQLATLGKKEKDVINMKVYEEKTYKEIAEALDMSVGHVGIVLHRIIKKLTGKVNQSPAGEGHE